MTDSPAPFPLAVNSSHHSSYHRFLLGAPASALAPLPRPECSGALAPELPHLAADLTLTKWRKLYHGALPWARGFGEEHYRPEHVPAHRPLPAEYARPVRKFAAYDLVQIADPALSALALVAGDRRVLAHFVDLNRDFCGRVEAEVTAYRPGPGGSRLTSRCLAGRFAEPNNRWLMPFLHVHTRVLNFTSFREAPRDLVCLDAQSLALGSRRAAHGGLERQADRLRDLGYRVDLPRDACDGLRVAGVSETLLAAMRAPRLALLRLLHRLVGEAANPARAAGGTEREAAVIAAMADRLEAAVVGALSFYRPPKLGLPAEGPWRKSVAAHLRELCPQDLEALTAAAAAARGKRNDGATFPDRTPEWTVIPVPAADAGHCHAPAIGELHAPDQQSIDSELADRLAPGERGLVPSLWLVRQYQAELASVQRELATRRQPELQAAWGRAAARIDALPTGPDLAGLAEAERTLHACLDRPLRPVLAEVRAVSAAAPPQRPAFASLDELVARARAEGRSARLEPVRERGGLSR